MDNSQNPAPKTSARKTEARLPRGLADKGPGELAATRRMMAAIQKTYELYGFEAVETPFIEFTDALGKFLPDQDRPNEGVFSFQDDDEQWLSLRYDLTAPLARYVAENFDKLPKPYRSYRAGYVFRNEKPGPGRFRQFMQFDADTVGAASVAADAEICMMAADTLEALGVARGDYVIKVNNRKVLDGMMKAIGLGGDEDASKRLIVLRAIDKLDRLGWGGVANLLREGRKDESGDFTKGANLRPDQVSEFNKSFEANNAVKILEALGFPSLGQMNIEIPNIKVSIDKIETKFNELDTKKVRAIVGMTDAEQISEDQIGQLIQFARTSINMASDHADGRIAYDYRNRGQAVPTDIVDWAFFNYFVVALKPDHPAWQGLDELHDLLRFVRAAGYGPDRIRIDPSVVRGLEYYTGPVFEAELTFEVKDEKGRPMRFGSVGGGGRYDGLVARFRGEPVPATGFSIGVSRLLAALTAIKSPIVTSEAQRGPVVVLVMDKDGAAMAQYQGFVQALRGAGISAELYLGSAGMNAQLKYADKRNSVCAIIQGSNERDKGEVIIKDLIVGAQVASAAKDMPREEYLALKERAQIAVAEAQLVQGVKDVLARH